jgi:hypothetical protein
MKITLPEKAINYGSTGFACVDVNRFYTILLDKDDRIVTYFGLLKNPKKVLYGKDGIRKELLQKKIQIKEYTGNSNKGIIVIIKPSKKSNYKNLVDILDEMAIAKIDTYVIIPEFTPEESKLLVSN